MADPVDTAPGPEDVQGPAPPRPEPVAGRPRLGSTAWIALGIAAVVVVATAIVLLAGNRPLAQYPAGSPEAALQGYLGAWYDEDYPSAYEYFSTRVKAQMSYEEFALFGYPSASDNQTVTIDRVTGEGDRRTIYVTVEDYYDSDFSSSYSHQLTVRVVLESGRWLIDDALNGVEPYYGGY
jgi:hypothetical protein